MGQSRLTQNWPAAGGSGVSIATAADAVQTLIDRAVIGKVVLVG